MDLKISDLKVGAKLIFGNYGVSTAVYPITWLKANKECEFLSEFVLDLLKFDYQERNNPNRDCFYHGNGNYEQSNIIQFMNSPEDDWYEPMHDYDAPPGNMGGLADAPGDYVHHSGFLSGFEDYEIECLASRVDLPSIANIYGAGGVPRFAMFNRKGFRGRPSIDLVQNKYCHDMNEDSFCEFWVSDRAGGYTATYVDRAGSRRNTYATCYHGLRPKCTINPDTKVEPLPDGSGFRIVPFTATKPRNSKVCTDEEFMALMGLL